jgi:ribosomal protein S27E
MSKDPASCPGISQFMSPTPSYVKCPKCGGNVEIWSDENETQCPSCGTVVSRDKVQSCLEYCEFADKCKDMIEAKKRKREEL